MEFLKSVVTWFFDNVYNVPVLIRAVGPYGLMAVVFAETGLLIGFFLPGDSLLITAGLFAAKGDLDIRFLVPSLILSAIVGNATGYAIGKRTGKALYSRPDSLLFRREHLQMTHDYYEKHGGKPSSWRSSSPSCGRSRRWWRAWRRWATPVCHRTTWWAPSVGGEHDAGRLRAREHGPRTSSSASTTWWPSSSRSRCCPPGIAWLRPPPYVEGGPRRGPPTSLPASDAPYPLQIASAPASAVITRNSGNS
jgi:membrane protein YqaA with SNARE-associated domain